MTENIKITQGDCLELMKYIPDGSIDMILCDLPFGMTRNKWDSVIPLDLLWNEYRRIAKPTTPIVLHCMQPFSSRLVMSNPKEFKYMWYWDKHLKTGFLNAKKQPLRQIEEIAVFYRSQCLFHPPLKTGKKPTHTYGKMGETSSSCYGKQNRNTLIEEKNTWCATNLVVDFPKVIRKGGHPTQKPVALLEYLIKTYTNECDTVLDSCMGSGSTGVACQNTNRKFIGFELDKEYYEIAKDRLGL